ncbi:MAG: hypothetical protein CM1200mP30_33920 [Pseudomonadota bacterium]|nr:MAG: hypothetical protein CM1200mP30_33920 [Pseudomonadota bacterium]
MKNFQKYLGVISDLFSSAAILKNSDEKESSCLLRIKLKNRSRWDILKKRGACC